jgi:glycosyltransferase 2 family protein
VNKRILWTVFKYLLAVGLLGVVVWWNWGHPENPNDRGLGYVWQHHVVEGRPINYACFGLAFLCFAVAVPITMVRWWILVRAQDLPFTLGNAFRLGLMGFFFSAFLPGSVGGDLVKAAGIARDQSRRTVAVATVIMDRLIGLWGLFWIVALIGGGFWLSGGLAGKAEAPSKLVVTAALSVVAVSVVCWLLLGLLSEIQAARFADRLTRLPKVGGSAAEFWRAVWMYRRRPASVFLALVLSLIGFLGFIPSFYFGAQALGNPDPAVDIPTLTQHFLFVPIGLVVQAAIPLPGGIGASEFGFGKLFGWFNCPESNGVLGSLVQRVLTWTLSLACYLIVAWISGTRPTTASEPAPTTPESASQIDARWSPTTGVVAANAAVTR